MNLIRLLSVAAIVGAVSYPGVAAWAGDPSVDDIVAALRPDASALKGHTRGIRQPSAAMEPEMPPLAGHRAHVHAVSTRVSPAAETATDNAGEGRSTDMTVQFVSGSAELTPAAAQMLSKLGRALSTPTLAAFRFRIEGHTDTVGTTEANRTLSQARAEKVASYLESEFGVQPARLETVGMGEQGLLVPTPDQTDEPRNRRVHVVNLGG